MSFYKNIIKINGKEKDRIGYLVPHLYRLAFSWNELKHFGLRLVKERLAGWTIWWTDDEYDFNQIIKELDELKKTHEHEFDYVVLK